MFEFGDLLSLGAVTLWLAVLWVNIYGTYLVFLHFKNERLESEATSLSSYKILPGISILKPVKGVEPGRGYYHWSLIDNFEWIKGFGPRFGLCSVDYSDYKREVRPSARYLREIIEAHKNSDSPSAEIISRAFHSRAL